MSDFTADVMSKLVQKNIRLHGELPSSIEINFDGGMKVWFAGHKDGKPWRAALSLVPDSTMAANIAAGNSDIISEACLQFIDHQKAKFF